MKAPTFNQEKTLLGAFSVIVKLCEGSLRALVLTVRSGYGNTDTRAFNGSFKYFTAPTNIFSLFIIMERHHHSIVVQMMSPGEVRNMFWCMFSLCVIFDLCRGGGAKSNLWTHCTVNQNMMTTTGGYISGLEKKNLYIKASTSTCYV